MEAVTARTWSSKASSRTETQIVLQELQPHCPGLNTEKHMDHRQSIQNFLVGREFTIPLYEVNNFYSSLLAYLDAMLDQLIPRVPDPILLAISPIEAGRQCVIENSRDHLAERVLGTAIKIIHLIAPDADELKAQNL